jgi:hypothetical protein
MFKKRTVFILGAGASIPYGFPSGYKLVSDIIDNLSNVDKVRILASVSEELHGSDNKFYDNNIKSLKESLSMAVVESIDDFLEARPEYLSIGKAAIAQALIPYETEQTLFNRNPDKNWYSMIFEVLRKDIGKLEDRLISFITFNYDRSLEHYLYTQLRNFLNIPIDESKKIMDKIPIIHIYGHIGNLEWQDTSDVRNYQPHAYEHQILVAMKRLLVIHEGNQVNENIMEAQRLIHQCEKIRLLGYGFHDTNTERLNLVVSGTGKDIRATSYGLSKLQRINIAKYFGNSTTSSSILDKEEKRDIVRFFREWIPLE